MGNYLHRTQLGNPKEGRLPGTLRDSNIWVPFFGPRGCNETESGDILELQ